MGHKSRSLKDLFLVGESNFLLVPLSKVLKNQLFRFLFALICSQPYVSASGEIHLSLGFFF